MASPPSTEGLRRTGGSGHGERLGLAGDDRLEALKGDRIGAHSMRVNDQWRVVFRWIDGHAHDVKLIDYH